MNYYKHDQNGFLVSASFQVDDTWTKTEKKIVRGWDGRLYFEDEEPEKPQDVLEAEALAQAKAERAAAVATITVTVDGMVFDGDEKAQERMARAVTLADSPDEQTEWVLHDNTVAIVTADQLRRACKLAGKAQTELWTVPYQAKAAE